MRLYVRGIDDIEGKEDWIKIESGEDPIVIGDFEPDPFSRVVNIYEGEEIKLGIFRYKIVGKEAYTRGDEKGYE